MGMGRFGPCKNVGCLGLVVICVLCDGSVSGVAAVETKVDEGLL